MTRPDEARFARGVAVAFLVVSVVKALLHEPWRDEWGPWGTAIDSRSLGETWDAVAFAGHPRVWPLLVFALQRTIGSFVAAQMLVALAATASVWIVARCAPFPRWARVAFAVGYFPLFEYGSIARPYVFALLAVCAAAATFDRARTRPLPFAAALLVLAQTSVFGVVLAAAFGVAWIVDQVRAPREERASAPVAAAAALVVVLGCAASVVQMKAPATSSFSAEWHSSWDGARVVRVLGTATRALLPLPKPQLHFWNTHVLDGRDEALGVVGAALVVGVAAFVARRPAALAFWLVAAGGQLAFAFVKYEGFARHHGHLFLAFVAAWWMASDGAAAEPRVRRVALGVVLGVQYAAGMFAVAMDAALAFSTADAAARELRVRELAHLPIVGCRGATTSGVAAALGRPIFLSGPDRVSTAMTWAPGDHDSTSAMALAEARRQAAAGGGPVVLVLDDAMLGKPPADVELVAQMPRAIVRDESFAIYVVRP